jgi:excisionase family DNA binding protein
MPIPNDMSIGARLQDRHTQGRTERFPLLTTADVALYLNVSEREARLMAECLEIPALKLGQRWRFRPSDLERYIQDRLHA